MITNGIVDKDLKILISSGCNSDVVQNDSIFFVAFDDESDPIAPKMFYFKIKQIYQS